MTGDADVTSSDGMEHVGPCSNPDCDNIMRWSGEWEESVCNKCDEGVDETTIWDGSERTNPNAWRVHRPYINYVDVRAAIINDSQPIHFAPEDCKVQAATDGDEEADSR